VFTIYPQIANRLRSKVTTLRTIDYDYGQLADPGQAAPMDYPSVLVSIESAKWTENGQKVQKGSLVIAVTVAIRPTIFNTAQTSPELWKYPAMMQPVLDVFTVLTGFKGGEIIEGVDHEGEEVEIQGIPFTGLIRTDTQRMKRYDEIQAFTHVFRCDITESSARPVYVKPTPQLAENDLELRVYTPNTVIVFPEELP